MSTTTVLFIWQVKSELQSYLRQGLENTPEVELVFPDEANEENYLRHAPDAQIIIGWRPSPALLESARALRLFINPGAGIRHLVEPFRSLSLSRGVSLANGHGNSYFTAQHAVGLLLALTNKITLHHNWMVQGKWRMGDADAASIPLRGQTVGLLGYGAVNSKVHQFLSGFDLSFSCLRRSFNDEMTEAKSIKHYHSHQLHAFLEQTDILMIAVPETSETVGLIGADELKLLGENAVLVNVARGNVVNEQALYEALATNSIAGAALDVWYDYQPSPDESGRKFPFHKPFHELDNVLLSPHRAASPFSDLKRWDEVIENIKRVVAGRQDFLNVVDVAREY